MTATLTPQQLIQQLRLEHPEAAARAGARLERGLRIHQAGMVEPTQDPTVYFVRSESNELAKYRVDLQARTCTCPDSGRGNTCKHRTAAWLYKETHTDACASASPQPEGHPHIRIAGKVYPVDILWTTTRDGKQYARVRSYTPQDWYPLIITWPVDQIFYL